jgi:drug/metabolite transporter (DMT)-like permease
MRISLRHYLGLVLGACLIAFSPIFAVLSRQGPGAVGMWDAAFWRVSIGAATLGLLFAFQRQRLWPARSEFNKGHLWLWFPGLVFAGDFWAWHWSFEHTSVANSTLLANTAILWVTLFAWLVWKERLGRVFVWGAIFAGLGVLLLMMSSANREPPVAGDPVFGDFLSLVTAGFYTAYQLSMKRFRRDHSAPKLMFWASAVGAIVLLPLALWRGDPFWPGSASVWMSLIGLGALCHAGGQGLIAYGLGGVPASLASVTLLVQPVLSAILGVWILKQPLVPWQIVGAVVVVIGLFFAIRGQWADRERGETATKPDPA